MFTSNPFAELSAFIPPAVMQTYLVAMILMVAGGTLFDMFHKKSAIYFFRAWRKSKSKATRQLGGGEMASMAVRKEAWERSMAIPSWFIRFTTSIPKILRPPSLRSD